MPLGPDSGSLGTDFVRPGSLLPQCGPPDLHPELAVPLITSAWWVPASLHPCEAEQSCVLSAGGLILGFSPLLRFSHEASEMRKNLDRDSIRGLEAPPASSIVTAALQATRSSAGPFSQPPSPPPSSLPPRTSPYSQALASARNRKQHKWPAHPLHRPLPPGPHCLCSILINGFVPGQCLGLHRAGIFTF